MGATSDCGDALHSRTNFSRDSMSVFERAVTVVLANDEMDRHLCQLLKTTPNQRHRSLSVQIVWGIFLKSSLNGNLSVPLSRPDGLGLSRYDHSVHAGTWTKVLADSLLVFFPRWAVHDPDSEVSQGPNTVLIVIEGSVVEVDTRS